MTDSKYQIEKVTYGDGHKAYYILWPNGGYVEEYSISPQLSHRVRFRTLREAKRWIKRNTKNEIVSKEIIK